MKKPKLIRITTIPLSLQKLLEGQLRFMSDYFEVTAISSEKEKLEAYAKEEGVDFYYTNLTRKITLIQDLLAIIKLFFYFRKVKPAIVHTHTPKAGMVGMIASFLARVPNRLHTVAGLPLMETKGLKRTVLMWVEKLTYRCATKVYPNAKGLLEFIIENKLSTPKKTKIIGNGSSNGIDLDYFSPSKQAEGTRHSIREEYGIGQDAFVFIFVGRLVGDKGINELIAAFSKISKERNNTALLLVGSYENDLDPLFPETLTAIKSDKKIITTGFQNDVRPFFSSSDALVFPSYREGFPNVVLQAGAMGLPSIVSDINGCNEIITAQENGLIIPVKNVEVLVAAMKSFIENKEVYLKLKANSRILIEKKYKRQDMWKAILEEYNIVID